MRELLFNDASTAKCHQRLDVVDKSLGVGSSGSCPAPSPWRNMMTVNSMMMIEDPSPCFRTLAGMLLTLGDSYMFRRNASRYWDRLRPVRSTRNQHLEYPIAVGGISKERFKLRS